MARPRKTDDERMKQYWTHLPPDVGTVIERAADRRDEHVSEIIRKLVLAGFHALKTTSS